MLTPKMPRSSPDLPCSSGTIYTTNRLSKEEMAQLLAEERAGTVEVQEYFSQSDSDILRQIRELSVPTSILLDKVGWKLLCTVRGLHMDQVSGDQWSDLCEGRMTAASHILR